MVIKIKQFINNLSIHYKLLTLVSAICLILFFKYIFGDYLYIFVDIGSDTINSYYPFLNFLNRHINDGFSLYSFNLGVGKSVLSYLLVDPFSIFIYICPNEYIASSIIFSIILKILFLSFTSYKFLELLFKQRFLAIVGALAIAFSGFFILWGQHYIFSSTFIYVPLLLYGFELFLQKNKKLVLIIASAFSILTIYVFFQISIFFCIYIIIRLFNSTYIVGKKQKIFFLIYTFLYIFIGVL
jgi:hypothetical protein